MAPPDSAIIELGGFNTIVHGRDASYMALNTDLYVGQALIRYGEYSEAEYQILRQLCKPGDNVVEVGSNLGAHGVRLAKHIGNEGRLIAIEPQPVVFQAMAASMALNSLTNVDCWPYALAAESGLIGMPKFDYATQQNFGGISMIGMPKGNQAISVHRLDDIYYYDRLDLLKVDVEGMELDVLKGAASCIDKYRPRIYLENDRPDKSLALIEWLFDAGYKLWWHTPYLFNPANYFKNPDNIYGDVASINMVAVHRSLASNISLPPVTSSDFFPQIFQAEKPDTL